VKTDISPRIIPVFIPHAGCPHQCVFCNQRAVTGSDATAPAVTAVAQAMVTCAGRGETDPRPVQIAFYGGNFLGLPPETVVALLAAAARFVESGQVDSIRFSTRPDTVSVDTLALVSRYPVATVEIGAQSMSDAVLARSRRGHRSGDTIRAVQLLKATGLEIGLQMMVGLPGDDDSTAIASGQAIAALAPDFVRIYPTVVLAGSPLARWYRQGRYRPLGLEAAVNVTKKLLILYHNCHIPVIRMGLQASAELDSGPSLLAGPYHPAFGHLVYEALFFDAICRRLSGQRQGQDVTIAVHPNNQSKLRGLKNRNIKRLKSRFQPQGLTIETNVGLAPEVVAVNGHVCPVYDGPGNTKTAGGDA